MPQLLRTVRQSRWFIHPTIPWLSPGELQADAFLDLKTEDNALSVFEVDDPANAERFAIAIAAGRDKPDLVDYAIFDGKTLAALGIMVQRIGGTTADATANKLHHNLHQLTARQLVGLADLVVNGTTNRILGKRVRQMLKDGLANGTLDPRQVNEKMLRQLQSPV